MRNWREDVWCMEEEDLVDLVHHYLGTNLYRYLKTEVVCAIG
jgi:hypothetical protein